MKRKEQENVERITKDQVKALDYTVQLVHLPHHKHVGKLREEVRASVVTERATCVEKRTDWLSVG